jgi:hypothetical protein
MFAELAAQLDAMEADPEHQRMLAEQQRILELMVNNEPQPLTEVDDGEPVVIKTARHA